MRFGKVVHIIFYDMYRGIKHNKYRYMICVFLIFSLMATFYLDVSVLRRGTRGDLPIAGVFDYIFYLLEGITEVTEKAYKEGKFVFPYIWIAVQFMCAFLVMSYPKNDLEGVGLNVLILSKSKKIWWISKCLWIFVSVFSIYLLIGIIAMLFTLLSGGTLEAVIHYEIFEAFSQTPPINRSQMPIILFVLVMPLLTSTVISILQMVVSVFSQPTLGMVAVFAIEILSVYSMNIWCLSNASMVRRSQLYLPSGLPFLPQIIYSVCVLAVSIIAGYMIFRRSDILSKE